MSDQVRRARVRTLRGICSAANQHGAPVVVGGGGNSAGQAALYLATDGCARDQLDQRV